MEAYLLDWANLLLRWLHVITAIAWVGSSLLFRLAGQPPDAGRQTPDLLEKGVDGALWAVHGGGFYNPQKYMLAPTRDPHRAALVLLGELLDLAHRLRAVHAAVPVERRHLPDRQEGVRLVGWPQGVGAGVLAVVLVRHTTCSAARWARAIERRPHRRIRCGHRHHLRGRVPALCRVVPPSCWWAP
jgi:hypothetical protein